MIKWAEAFLLSHGYTLVALPETIQKTPYSSVVRFLTSSGAIYLKQTPPTLFLEAETMEILCNQFHANVPTVIQQNKALNCFLMKDYGGSLREHLKNDFQPDLLCQGIKKYTHIQRAVENDMDAFFALGVPDWRLGKLPEFYMKLIGEEREENLLRQDGITTNELKILHEFYPIFLSMCELLASYKIPETLDHCDFHDNNILIEKNTKVLTIIDWGETVIAHPFFPLISFISTAAYRYKLQETDPLFITLEDACFESWLGNISKHALREAMCLAKKIWPIYSALGYYRLMISSNMNTDAAELKSYFNAGRNTGRLAQYFKEFIKVSVGLDPEDTSRVNLSDSGRPIHG
ncbi:MAG TPA: phosphotransferase [Gammaproteobacteria bacterium]|nr:phosphotransferase [Gammaproteobacteria bacterium]